MRATLESIAAAVDEGMERTALILVGPALAAEGFDESRLYAPDYERRFRPQSALANSPTAAPADEGRGERQHAGC